MSPRDAHCTDLDLRLAEVAEACALLKNGADGRQQPARIRPFLKALEANGLAQYQGAGGWRLTSSGRERALEARCQECAACQEWILSPDGAPPCAKLFALRKKRGQTKRVAKAKAKEGESVKAKTKADAEVDAAVERRTRMILAFGDMQVRKVLVRFAQVFRRSAKMWGDDDSDETSGARHDVWISAAETLEEEVARMRKVAKERAKAKK